MKIFNCPTEEVWADVLTQPLQRKLFQVMRARLMNCHKTYEKSNTTNKENGEAKTVTGRVEQRGSTKTLQECVGRSRFSQAGKVTARPEIGVAMIQNQKWRILTASVNSLVRILTNSRASPTKSARGIVDNIKNTMQNTIDQFKDKVKNLKKRKKGIHNSKKAEGIALEIKQAKKVVTRL
jgi:hypothetical protein